MMRVVYDCDVATGGVIDIDVTDKDQAEFEAGQRIRDEVEGAHNIVIQSVEEITD